MSTRRQRHRPAGFSLVEVLLAVVILSFALIGTAQLLMQDHLIAPVAERDATARLLLRDGFARVWRLPRIDPDDPPKFGKESGDPSGVQDDVDDLDGVKDDPPQTLTGQTMGSEWRRRYHVDSVDPADPTQKVSKGSTYLMEVEIEIEYQSELVVSGRQLMFWPGKDL